MPPAPQQCRDGTTVLRRWALDDASAAASAVRESLGHLSPWMPWATPAAGEEPFQAARLARVIESYGDDRADWDFAVTDTDGELIGACGILVRDGAPRVWYWLREAYTGYGHATRAARLATEIWRTCRAEDHLEIRTDEANQASAAVASRCGYRRDRVINVEPETGSESGRMVVWVLERGSA